MIDPIQVYLAVCHTNMNGSERIEVGIFEGWKLQKRGHEFCSPYQVYATHSQAEDVDFAMAIQFAKDTAAYMGLPCLNTLSMWE